MWQVDSAKITNYNASKGELQALIIFWILAAGKTASSAERILLKLIPFKNLPFEQLKKYSEKKLAEKLKSIGCGCYNNKAKTIYEIVNSNYDLKKCSIEDLEKIFGIGKKTSRAFILHSRKQAKCAVLDCHLLKYLNFLNFPQIPSKTPSNKNEYIRIEKYFLYVCRKLNIHPANLDLEIWKLFRDKIDFSNEKFNKFKLYH